LVKEKSQKEEKPAGQAKQIPPYDTRDETIVGLSVAEFSHSRGFLLKWLTRVC